VEIGAHVHNGSVVRPPHPDWHLAVPLGDRLCALFANRLPVIIENDVNALAVLATHNIEYPESDLVVVAVLDEGVGGGLIMDGRLRRGGKGMAMEIGHLTVGHPSGVRPDPNDDSPMRHPLLQDFDRQCPCGSFDHLDAFATPMRIRATLGVSALHEAAYSLATTSNGEHCREYDVFYAAGSVLGRGVAHIINIVNPDRLIIWLPEDLLTVPPNLAGAAYVRAMKEEMEGAYSTGAEEIALTLNPLTAENTAVLGATAAAMCVLDGFINHARGLDGCPTPQRRVSRDSAPNQRFQAG
jgi:predicted NBD/HSP70 family sugar kinase